MTTSSYGMSSSEQLSMLLDGELHSSEAPGLFYELSQNHELQEEMFELIKLKNIMKMPQPAPKDKLKAGILAGIGLSGAGTIYTAANSTGMGALLSGKVFLTGAAAVLSSILTFFTVTSLTSPKEPEGRDRRALASVPFVSSAESSKVSSVSPDQGNALPGMNTVERVKIIYVEREPVPATDRSSGVAEDKPSVSQELLISSVDINDLEKPYISSNMLTEGTYLVAPVFKSNARKSRDDFERNGSEYFLMSSAQDEALSGLKLEVRGFSSQHFNDLNLALANDPAINNIAVGLLYDINERYSVGLEFGQENFYQQFTGINGTKTFPIEQNSVQFWGVGVFRYSAGRLEAIGGVQPFAQVGLGSTNAALISRLGGGLRYEFSNKFGIFAGLEWTSLYYKSNSIWNTTNKAGLTYGMTLKF